MRRSIFLLLALVGAAAARELLAPTPTQQLNAQKAAQQQAQAQQAQAAAARSQAAQRLKPPCYVPSSWYPIASCVVSTDPAVCGRGFLAFPTEKHCCTPQRGPLGAFPAGCTDVGKEVGPSVEAGVAPWSEWSALSSPPSRRPPAHRHHPSAPAAELLDRWLLAPHPDLRPDHRLCHVQPQLGQVEQRGGTSGGRARSR